MDTVGLRSQSAYGTCFTFTLNSQLAVSSPAVYVLLEHESIQLPTSCMKQLHVFSEASDEIKEKSDFPEIQRTYTLTAGELRPHAPRDERECDEAEEQHLIAYPSI